MNLDIPFWHPVVVHFPIALLVVGAGTAAVYAAVGRPFWRSVTLLLCAAGTLGAAAAVRTGEAIYEAVEGTPVVEELVGQHEEFGEWGLWVGVATVAALGGVALWGWRTARGPAERDPLAPRFVVLVLAVTAAVLVARAGHLGGLMVWGV